MVLLSSVLKRVDVVKKSN